MTVATAPLEAVLARHDTATPDLETMNADDLKRRPASGMAPRHRTRCARPSVPVP